MQVSLIIFGAKNLDYYTYERQDGYEGLRYVREIIAYCCLDLYSI